ncbi:MAG: PHP domain-containing protein [Candidatus Nealsonbacteria bacterium]|nr:PHP domain-containing protein [Candidatus Nealsonbacteria bacterium]
MHSYYSDGRFSPTELLGKCKDSGLEIVSLTDHENVGGIDEALEAGEKLGIKVIPGIEFATEFQGQEHHIIGYFIDRNSQKLKEFLDKLKESKAEQIKEIIKNLQAFGFRVSFEEVASLAKGSLDRYHIVLTILPDHEKTLKGKEEHRDFFKKFLMEKSGGGEGLAFVERKKPDIRLIIDAIHESGGVAFWAHPFWRIKDGSIIRELAATFKKMKLNGIEVLYPYHSKDQSLLLHELGRDLLLYESAGSDFHREDTTIRQLANFQDFGIKINFPFCLKETR